ncbi:sugar transferase [candidate division KSB1 bacterium]|nr:sugar transferase [candidate division KSB1 bacterium]
METITAKKTVNIIKQSTSEIKQDLPMEVESSVNRPLHIVSGPIYRLKRIVWCGIISPGLLLISLFLYTFIPLDFFRNGKITSILRNANNYMKRILDITGAIICLVPFTALFLFIAILIKLDSNGPVLYTQMRIGRNRRNSKRRSISIDTAYERRTTERRRKNLYGTPFTIYKFRTMKLDAENKCGPVWATINDPRITTIGRILRYTHLDELPQVINILKGEMSFVGPRPERPHFINELAERIPCYLERLKVKPGLTGLAQVNCGHDYSIESVRTKLNYDLTYCQNGNLVSYFKIIFTTLHKKLSGKI